MSRLGSWLRGPSRASASTHTQPINATEEAEHLAQALQAASLIMEENIEGAEKELSAANTSFNKLGLGVTVFMRALLGFEPEVMKAAVERLTDAENANWADMKRAQKHAGGFQSKIYPAGSEFALCYSESMLMSAVVAVLSENLVEAVKGFYKMRKAFITLDGIMEVEHKYMRKKEGLATGSSKGSLFSQVGEKNMPGGFGDDNIVVENGSTTAPGTTDKSTFVDEITNQHVVIQRPSDSPDDSDLEFVDADEAHSGAQTPANYLGHVRTNEDVERKMEDLFVSNNITPESSEPEMSTTPVTTSRRKNIDLDSNSDIFSNPIDVYIHSGTNLCYGLMLLIISMVPPAFTKLLSIIGFKGDRDRGIRMLWQSTKFANLNAAVGGLVLLGYYNGLVGFSDIILEDQDATGDNLAGFPRAKCAALLEDMRSRYPKSRLWRLEEARMQSGKRNLKGAIEILTQIGDSPMKQVKALGAFELSMNAMWIHDYSLCATSFLNCVELNNWSHCLYTFIAGCAYVEMYRDLKTSDPDNAAVHLGKAVELLKKAPTLAGKKRFMAKQLPFEVYVARKIQKWEERAKEWGVDFIDAVGVSPIEEMIYLWNGSKRMSMSGLETSLEKLDWQRTSHPEKLKTNLDEVALHALLLSSILRNLGRFDEARKALQDNILGHDAAEFKGHLRDDWTNPSAQYEMAVLAWFEKGAVPAGAARAAKVAECEDWLRRVAKWETYVLDTRIGLKVTTGIETLRIYNRDRAVVAAGVGTTDS